MPTREEQKEQRENEILMAALDLFIKKGYGGTKIADIAKAANMSVGLLFHYFESKEKLYEVLIEMGIMGPKSMMLLDHSNPIAFFQTVTEYVFGFIRENYFSAKIFVLMIQVGNQEPISEKIAQMIPEITNVRDSVEIIKKGQEMGQIRDGDPLALSALFWGAIQGVAQGYAMDSTVPLPEAEWLVDLLRRKE